MKITETQLKELIQEELALNEWVQLAAQALGTLLTTEAGRGMIAKVLRMPDTLHKSINNIDDAILAKVGMKTPGFLNKIQDLQRMTQATGMIGKVADWIEGATDEEMQALTAAAKAAKTATPPGDAAAPAPAAAAPTPASPPGRVGFQESQMNLTTARFKQIVQEELAHTTQMERKLK